MLSVITHAMEEISYFIRFVIFSFRHFLPKTNWLQHNSYQFTTLDELVSRLLHVVGIKIRFAEIPPNEPLISEFRLFSSKKKVFSFMTSWNISEHIQTILIDYFVC